MSKKILVSLGLVLVLTLGFSTLLWGEEILSLEKALEIALRDNPTIRKVQSEVEIAHSSLRLAENRTFSPQVEVDENIALGGDFPSSFSLNIKDSYSFKDSTEEKKARLKLEAQERTLQETEETIKQEVLSVYVEILKSENSLLLAEKNQELLKRRYEKVREQFRQGNAGSFQVREAEKNLKDGEANLVNLQRNLAILKEKLNSLLGRPIDVDFSTQPLPEVGFPNLDLEELKSFARENRVEIENLITEKRSIEIDIDSIREEKRPKVSLLGEYAAEDWSLSLAVDPLKGNLDWELSRSLSGSGSSFLTSGVGEENWGVGIVISWIFSSGGVWREKERQNELKLSQIEEDFRSLLGTVESEIEEKYFAFQKSQSDLQIRKQTIAIEEEKQVLRKKQYEIGAIESDALLESEIVLLQAQNDYQNNLYDLILGFFSLQKAAGKPILVKEIFSSGSKGVME
ncbi:MAG: TolC family protein [Candidatus Caldatribacteriaceae bacterium]